MNLPLHLYFNDLLGNREGQRPTLVFDNARIPCAPPIVQSKRAPDTTDHTRSTVSASVSTLSSLSISGPSITSESSTGSVISTGSTGSGGSCRWDSNPSSKDKNVTRPKRPGRQPSSDGLKELQLLDRTPRRTLRDTRLRNEVRSKNEKENDTDDDNEEGEESTGDQPVAEHLHEMVAATKKTTSSDSDSTGSENSLKKMFRRTSCQRRSSIESGIRPLPGTNDGPVRTVNEILGESIQELKLAW